MAERRVVVVGGGVIGVCCAYFLAKGGAGVILVERDEIGGGASFGNAGTIAPGHPPLNKPGRIPRSVLELLSPKSPLYIPMRWDPGLFRWLWTFRTFCTEYHLSVSMGALAPLGQASLDLFDLLVESEGLNCNYERSGYYEICRTERGLRETRHDAAMMRQYGYHPHEMGGDELREIEPAILESVVGGVHFPEAATCDPHRFVLELADRSVRHGARIETGRGVSEILSTGSAVNGVRLDDGEILDANAVVLATGSYSGSLTREVRTSDSGSRGEGLPPGSGARGSWRTPTGYGVCFCRDVSVLHAHGGVYTVGRHPRVLGDQPRDATAAPGTTDHRRRGVPGWDTGRRDPLGMVRAQALHAGRDSVRGSGPGAIRTLCGDRARDAGTHTRSGDR